MTDLRNRVTGALLLATLLATAATAQQPAPRSFSSYFFFGDSLTDNGNLFAATGSPPAPYFQGRVSNGPTYAEYLRPGLAANLTAAPTVRTNLNFAFAGATAGTAVTSPPNIAMQIGQYQLRGITAAQNDVFVLLAGANDLLNTVANPATQNGPALTAAGQATAQTVAGHVQTLLALGAKNLVVVNLPNIGNTPRFLTGSGSPARTIIEQGSLAFNAELRSRIAALTIPSNVNVTLFDLGSVFDFIRANASAYGFSVINQEYLGILQAGGNPGDINGYMFFDGIHPTTRTHQILANAMTEALNPEFALGHTAVQGTAVLAAADMHADAVDARLDQIRGSTTRNKADGYFGFSVKDGSRDWSGYRNEYEYSTQLATAGFDWQFNDNWVVGLAFSKDSTEVTHKAGAGGLKLKGESVTVLAAWRGPGTFSFEGTATYGAHDVRGIRRTTALGFQTGGETDGDRWGASFRIVGDFGWEGFKFTPFAGYRFLEATTGTYNESGVPGLNMVYREQTSTQSSWQVGASGNWSLSAGSMPLVLGFTGAFQGELSEDTRSVAGRLHNTIVSNDASIFTEDGSGDSIKLGLRLSGSVGKRWGWTLGYTAEVRDDGDTASQYGVSLQTGF